MIIKLTEQSTLYYGAHVLHMYLTLYHWTQHVNCLWSCNLSWLYIVLAYMYADDMWNTWQQCVPIVQHSYEVGGTLGFLPPND